MKKELWALVITPIIGYKERPIKKEMWVIKFKPSYPQNLCESAFEFSKDVLKPGGNFLCKLWDGYGTQGEERERTHAK